MNRFTDILFAGLASLAVATVSITFADEAKPAPKPDAKDTKPADNEASLDDLLKLPGDNKKPTDKPAPTPAKIDKPEPLTGNEPIDAVLKAINEMEQAGQRLRVRQDPGIETQRLQESILKRLDQAIAMAQQQKQQQQQQQQQKGSSQQKQESGSPQNQPQKQDGNKEAKQPNKQSNEPTNQDQVSKGQVDPHNHGGPLEESRIEWGRLPARIRGELDQGLAEKFSPLYKRLTEAYYRRLAEEGKD